MVVKPPKVKPIKMDARSKHRSWIKGNTDSPPYFVACSNITDIWQTSRLWMGTQNLPADIALFFVLE